ncbi:MAG TPA: serine hydrolase [Verrucomicrobiae bacterium]|nr:serine hydrolase [Verrucomicrobiae bacterium]
MKHSWIFLALMASNLIGADMEEIRAALVDRVDVSRKAVGVVVGAIDAGGTPLMGYGRAGRKGDAKLDGDTMFEIGSMTKVFTSLVLADMVERGEVKPDDPVAKYLPAGSKVPTRNGKQITLLDLSMQVSGLPRLPDNLKPADASNPYADYTGDRLLDFLSRYTLTRDIGERYEYSNLGVGLLGFALAHRAGMSYEEMVRRRILEPLGMSSTTITLSGEQKKRMAAGHNAALEPVNLWDMGALEGAGALRSTANDILKFLAAGTGLADTPLKAAVARMRSVHRETDQPDLEIQMAWHVWHKYGGDIVWHNGGTYGFHSFMGFDPAAKRGVVVLCNTSFDIDDIGRHVLDSRWPLANLTAAKSRTEIPLSPEAAERISGVYVFRAAISLTVSHDGPRVFVQLTGQPKLEIFAESETEFFLKVVNAQLSFERDASGKVAAVVLHQNGLDQRAVRK